MMQSVENLVEVLKKHNEAYRSGTPLVSDHEYDDLVEQLRLVAPDHPFLASVEPEVLKGKIEVKHPDPMLSIEKAYNKEVLERFLTRVKKEADQINAKEVSFKVTPKLDGLAARDDGKIFATRGNGEVGYEISGVFQKGVIPVGGRGLGIGEIVIVKSYFDEHLSDKFEHPRNMVVGIVSSDTVNDFARKAIQDKAVRFVPYVMLDSWEGEGSELLKNIEKITTDLAGKTDYPQDGMVASAVDETLRAHMGATAHHYRWQVAVKEKGETACTVVEDIKWQVGRTGNVTPVMEVKPVSLSGATIRRVTAHNAGNIKQKRIGINSEIEVIRSGEVIPKLEKVVKKSLEISIPEKCPSCSQQLEWNKDFLQCKNSSCPDQTTQKIYHWFKTLGNADWFGIKTVEKLVETGFDSLEKIYSMKEKDFINMGFGPVQSKNLSDAIDISKNKEVEDWRFLAAFGVSDLGKGDSRKLLMNVELDKLTEIKAEDIIKIHGFGEITSRSIEDGITEIKDTINHMLSLGFNLEKTPIKSESSDLDTPVAGKGIVFTGKMLQGSREEMQDSARKLGAKVQTAVSSKTDYLVCGEKVGEKKIEKAKGLNVQIISEDQYLDMING